MVYKLDKCYVCGSKVYIIDNKCKKCNRVVCDVHYYGNGICIKCECKDNNYVKR